MGTTQPPSSATPEAPPTPPEEYLYPEVRDLLEAKVALGELCEAAGSSDLDGRGALVLAQLDRFHLFLTHLRIEESLDESRANPSEGEHKHASLQATLKKLRHKVFAGEANLRVLLRERLIKDTERLSELVNQLLQQKEPSPELVAQAEVMLAGIKARNDRIKESKYL